MRIEGSKNAPGPVGWLVVLGDVTDVVKGWFRLGLKIWFAWLWLGQTLSWLPGYRAASVRKSLGQIRMS